MEERLYTVLGMDKTVQKLIRLYGTAPVQARELADWFASVFFEELRPEISCLAARLAAVNEFAGVPDGVKPRLQGILRYIRTLNAGVTAGLHILAAELHARGIAALLPEETGLYLAWPDAPQRQMWQVRIGVPESRYAQALDVARSLGYTVETGKTMAVVQKGNIQRFLILPVSPASYLWDGAVTVAKSDCLVPQNGTVLISLSEGAFRAMTKPQPSAVLVRWAMDMKVLLCHMEQDDWLCAARIAKKEHVGSHLRLLLSVYSALSGVSIGEKYRQLFATKTQEKKLLCLLTAFRALPITQRRLRRSFLLCRLRRPDSRWAATRLFIKQACKKVTGK